MSVVIDGKQDLYAMLETACNEHMKAQIKNGGRHHTTRLWKKRIDWIERRLAREYGEA